MSFNTSFDFAYESQINEWFYYKTVTEFVNKLDSPVHRLYNTIDTTLAPDKLTELLIKECKKSFDLNLSLHAFDEPNDPLHLIFVNDLGIMRLDYYSKRQLHISTVCGTSQQGQAWIDGLKKIVPEPEVVPTNSVTFSFYMYADGGPSKNYRTLSVPEWNEIEKNYQIDTRTQMTNLINLDPETIGDGGKLILLHGDPGLGKSFAIRALMRSVKSWADPIYLMDPEKFFAIPPYMFTVLLGDHGETKKWKIVIAEDSDEFIRADAKERSGQGLSRLLNLADGILGQGMKILFLLTTNEPLKNLHPAIIRPGRCLANIEFKSFNPKEAKKWLGPDFDHSLLTPGDKTLAELYDLTKGAQQINSTKELVATGQYL